MRRRHVMTAALKVVALSVGAAAVAQQEGSSGSQPDPAQVTASMSKSLEEISATLKELLARQDLDLLARRIDLKARRIAALEAQMRDARNDRDGAEEERTHLRLRMEQFDEDLDRRQAVPGDGGVDPMRAEREMIELRYKQLGDRIDILDLRLAELQSEIAVREDELEGLEDSYDRRLGLK